MKTRITLEIDHRKPLPDKTPLTDIVSQRVYNFLFSQGCECGVTATLETPLQVREMTEPGDGR